MCFLKLIGPNKTFGGGASIFISSLFLLFKNLTQQQNKQTKTLNNLLVKDVIFLCSINRFPIDFPYVSRCILDKNMGCLEFGVLKFKSIFTYTLELCNINLLLCHFHFLSGNEKFPEKIPLYWELFISLAFNVFVDALFV